MNIVMLWICQRNNKNDKKSYQCAAFLTPSSESPHVSPSLYSIEKKPQNFSFSFHLVLVFCPAPVSCPLCVKNKEDVVQRVMTELLRVSVIFGCDIFIASLNVFCEHNYHPATTEGKTGWYRQTTKRIHFPPGVFSSWKGYYSRKHYPGDVDAPKCNLVTVALMFPQCLWESHHSKQKHLVSQVAGVVWKWKNEKKINVASEHGGECIGII